MPRTARYDAVRESASTFDVVLCNAEGEVRELTRGNRVHTPLPDASAF